VKASTYDSYRMAVNMWKTALGTTMLADLKRKDIREVLDGMRETNEKLANKTLANRQSVLRAAPNEATADEIISVNPMLGWTYTLPEAPKEEDDVDPLSAEKQQLLLNGCAETAERNMFKFAFWTGLRTSEYAAVRWGDVDWVRGAIRISRAWTTTADRRGPRGHEDQSRSAAIKLLAPALEALEAQKPLTLLADGYIFLNPRTGEPWRGKTPIWTAWGRAIRKAKVAYRKPYQTRHTYASMMLSAGKPPM
jgi:integrase